MDEQLIWNVNTREDAIKKAKTDRFDLIIIGGGITGAGVAREAALRNISFCLVDKNDFGFGTSSRSSKLAHGGIRYLANGELKIVRESTTERNWLRVHFPNLIRPLGFVYTAFEGGKDKSYMVRIGTFLYDLLSDWFSEFKNFKKRKFYSKKELKKIEPKVRTDGLKVAGIYYDTNVDDSRLTLESIKEALVYSEGKSVAINYCKVEQLSYPEGEDKVDGVNVVDVLTNSKFKIKGKHVINCTGIWTDDILEQCGFTQKMIRPTKGVHVIVPNERLGNVNAFGIRSRDDGRFFFILRREHNSIIGTTDTDYRENLDEPFCYKEDCDYLLNTVNWYFPDAKLTYDDIVSTYAGIRPLILEAGMAESKVSRKHEIIESKNGVITLAGGKLTIYRLMAEDLLFYMVNKGHLPKFKGKQNKKGYSQIPFKVGITREAFDKKLKEMGLEKVGIGEQNEHLHRQYGTQGFEILSIIKDNPEKGKPLLEGYPFCEAEIEFIIEYESPMKLVDVMLRRTEIQLHVWHHKQKQIAEKVAAIMANLLGWSAERKQKEIDEYMNYIKKTIWF
jgi:glycerol-3-phosphate dehydrogenase